MDIPFVRQLIRLRFTKAEICNRAAISPENLETFIFENNIEVPRAGNRQHYLDDTYFSIIDTEEKAYWLGFLYADGCLSTREYEYTIRLTLQAKDAAHVENFRKAIKAEHHVSTVRSTFEYKGETKPRTATAIVISSKQMWEDLNRLGCTPTKTFTLVFPTSDQVPDHLLHHFVRGYFDGDGCMWISKNKQSSIASFVSSKAFIERLEKLLKEHFGVIKTYVREHHATKGVFYLCVKRVTDIIALSEHLYRNSTVYLSRKRLAFDAVSARHDARLNVRMDKICKEKIGQLIDYRRLSEEYGLSLESGRYSLHKLREEGRLIEEGKRQYGKNGRHKVVVYRVVS